MTYNPEIHHGRSLRLKGYDYAEAGAYFLTICTKERGCVFGEVVSGKMRHNSAGAIILRAWKDLRAKYADVELDEFIIMPNHIHGILAIQDNMGRGEVSSPDLFLPDSKPNLSKQKGGETPPLLPTLGRIIAYLKYQCAKQINIIRNASGVSLWQRNYYEHIIRNEDELNRIREYIMNNPARWADDENNPANLNRTQ